MPVLFPLYRIDVWEPTEAVATDGTVSTPLYTKTHSNLKGNLQAMTAQEKVVAGGFDLTARMRNAFLPGSFRTLDHLAILVDTVNAEFWQGASTPELFDSIIAGKEGHWEILVVELNTPPSEVAAGY